MQWNAGNKYSRKSGSHETLRVYCASPQPGTRGRHPSLVCSSSEPASEVSLTGDSSNTSPLSFKVRSITSPASSTVRLLKQALSLIGNLSYGLVRRLPDLLHRLSGRGAHPLGSLAHASGYGSVNLS